MRGLNIFHCTAFVHVAGQLRNIHAFVQEGINVLGSNCDFLALARVRIWHFKTIAMLGVDDIYTKYLSIGSYKVTQGLFRDIRAKRG